MMGQSSNLHPVLGEARLPWFWMGMWSMGGDGWGKTDLRESMKTLEQGLAYGVRHFDTAGLYGKGKSDSLLAHATQGARKEIFISTKGGLVWEGNTVRHRASPASLRSQLEESLTRLNTSYIDLFSLHWPDPELPIQESLEALVQFQSDGLIRYWGIGNWDEAQIQEHLKDAARVPHHVHFSPYHQDSLKTLSAGKAQGRCLNCVTSPFEQGRVFGKSKTELGKKDRRLRNPYFHHDFRPFDRCIDSDKALDPEIASWPLASQCLYWILSHDEVDVVIPGPRRPAQLADLRPLLGYCENIVRHG